MGDPVDLPGQALELRNAETESTFGDIAHHDLEATLCQGGEALLELGVALEGRRQAAPSGGLVGGTHQANQLPAGRREPLRATPGT